MFMNVINSREFCAPENQLILKSNLLVPLLPQELANGYKGSLLPVSDDSSLSFNAFFSYYILTFVQVEL
jgi:hypothetical protein